ncbi:7TM GPCR serpentine receptor class x (Srx) domain-containing protein [Caenorhabditis elegans]|uniref:7TM GPCR serpentine receptor class x (Srx) domain-containing protein n=1 Tax=Caenorhabditis elegans TaxID=6239 RepID=O45695_CAEEL|nr:7TM GPCR serpentine receptor class x (Srx) domain-containing protein [Caenorhabditis elegans]CCD72132.1 7TM GPCR serpentine receptor class x (Srx) domain-containing protein [Caenorhabditis elegans]|eukprot:NP_001294722.1 Serpentine Receptor, class X [Caenorhabditis elegans]
MIELTVKSLLGGILFATSSIGLLLNLLVVSPVFQLAFAKDKSSIYVISSVNIINDILHLLITTFYLAPTIILNSFIFSDERNGNLTVFISFIFMVLWYIGNITQIVMAVNRWAVICILRSSMFTKRNLIICFSFTLVFAVAKSYIVQYVFPCCSFLVDQTVLSYSYFQIENITNYTDHSDIPLNALSSIVPVICYSWIFYTIRSAHKSITPNMAPEHQKRQGRQELSYAMQFCLISMFYTFSWIMFRVFPIIFVGRHIEWFILTSMCHVFNCSANAFVYILFNQEIRKILAMHKFLRISGIATTDYTHSHENMSKVKTITIPSSRQAH